MTVGRGESQAAALDLHEDSGEHRPGLIGGGRHLSLFDCAYELVQRHLEPVAFVGTGTGRKLFGLDALDVRIEARAPEAEGLIRTVERHLEILVRQRADE